MSRVYKRGLYDYFSTISMLNKMGEIRIVIESFMLNAKLHVKDATKKRYAGIIDNCQRSSVPPFKRVAVPFIGNGHFHTGSSLLENLPGFSLSIC